MDITSNPGIGEVAQHVLLSRRVILICLEELEWNIRKRYADRMPTTRNRIRGFVKKRIEQLRARDALFDDYVKLLELLEMTYKSTVNYAIQVYG